MKLSKTIATALTTLVATAALASPVVVHLAPEEGDMTPRLREIFEKIEDEDEVKIILEKGQYLFKPDYAYSKYCTITNHGNGLKSILFPIEGFDSFEIEGNGAEIICHGQMFPFLGEESENIRISNLSIDWDIPFTFLSEVLEVNEKEGWRIVRPIREERTWTIKNGAILFPNVDGFNYKYLGSSLCFDPQTKNVTMGSNGSHSNPNRVEELPNGNLKIYEKMRHYPAIGSLHNSKGDRENDRYAPAFDFKSCKNITLDGVTVHHALGMAYLFERSENIQLLNSKVVLPEGKTRVVSSTADASHFANCRGDILIENCRFENMLDDGTNVHGTYVTVNKIIDSHTMIVELMHFEQLGFHFAEQGDELAMIQQPSIDRAARAKVKDADYINERYIRIEMLSPLPASLKEGDLVENMSWSPNFTMRGCTIRNHRARNIVLKTDKKIVIENNNLSSMMASILFRGEAKSWYESGAVEDVLIRGNHFTNCLTGSNKQAVLYISPVFNPNFDDTVLYDRNIRFVDNTIEDFSQRLVWADRVEGLLIKGNKITRRDDGVNDPLFDLVNSKDVIIEENSYNGKMPSQLLKCDERSRKTLKIKDKILK